VLFVFSFYFLTPRIYTTWGKIIIITTIIIIIIIIVRT